MRRRFAAADGQFSQSVLASSVADAPSVQAMATADPSWAKSQENVSALVDEFCIARLCAWGKWADSN